MFGEFYPLISRFISSQVSREPANSECQSVCTKKKRTCTPFGSIMCSCTSNSREGCPETADSPFLGRTVSSPSTNRRDILDSRGFLSSLIDIFIGSTHSSQIHLQRHEPDACTATCFRPTFFNFRYGSRERMHRKVTRLVVKIQWSTSQRKETLVPLNLRMLFHHRI